jgi:ketosteroid isomerase-like protein
MRTTLFVLGVATVLCTGCSRASGPAFDRADADRIKQVIEQLRTAFNAKDSLKAAALYSTTAAVMPPNQPLMRGRQFVQQYYTARFGEGASNLELQATDVSGQGTLAYAIGDYRLNLVPPKGGQPRLDRGKFLWVFREQNGQWLIEYVIFSSDFEAPPSA